MNKNILTLKELMSIPTPILFLILFLLVILLGLLLRLLKSENDEKK